MASQLHISSCTAAPAGEWPLQDSERLCAHLVDAALQRLPEGGESLLGVFDLRGFGPINADFDFFYFMVRRRATPCCTCALQGCYHPVINNCISSALTIVWLTDANCSFAD